MIADRMMHTAGQSLCLTSECQRSRIAWGGSLQGSVFTEHCTDHLCVSCAGMGGRCSPV